MATTHQVPMTLGPTGTARRTGLAVTRWVLTVVGAISAFIGAFILLGGEDQWIGLGGDASWRVGEIDALWGWGLLVGGVIFLVGGVALFLRDRTSRKAGAEPVEAPGADLAAHAAVFVLVNSLLWVQDVLVTGGINYVLWVTIPWAVGLGVQAVAFFMGRRA